MRKLFITILVLVFSIISHSQGTFPTKIPGNTKTQMTYNEGTVASTTGFTFYKSFADTTEANSILYVKYTPGMLIRTGNDYWTRDNTATFWTKISGSGGGGFTSANNGVTSPSSSIVQLGKLVSDAGSAGLLTADREILTADNGTEHTLTFRNNVSASTPAYPSYTTKIFGGEVEFKGYGGGYIVNYILDSTGGTGYFPGTYWYQGYNGSLLLFSGFHKTTTDTHYDLWDGRGATQYVDGQFNGQSTIDWRPTGETYMALSGSHRVGVNRSLNTLRATLDVNGTISVSDSVKLFSRILSNTDSIYGKRSDGTLGAISPSSIVGVNIYNSDGTLTSDRTINANNNDLIITNNTLLQVDNGVNVQITAGTALTGIYHGNDGFEVSDSNRIKPYLGKLNIDTLRDATTQTKMLVWGGLGNGIVGGASPGYGLIMASGLPTADTSILMNKAGSQVGSGIKNWTSLQKFSAGLNLSSTAAPLQVNGSAGTSGQVLTSAGAGATPTWAAASGAYWVLTGTSTLTGNVLINGNGNQLRMNGGSTSMVALLDDGTSTLGDANVTGNGNVFIANDGAGTFVADNTAHTAMLGVNTGSPAGVLDVRGIQYTGTDNYLKFENGAQYSLFSVYSHADPGGDDFGTTYLTVDAEQGIAFTSQNGNASNDVVFSASPGSGTLNFSATNGSVFTGIVTISNLSAGGAVTAGAGTGTLSVVSDGRLKHDIAPYQFGLREILQTNPITFRYNADQKMGDGLYAGFDARDVYNIYGSLGAGTDSKGYHSLFDKAILGALVNGMKEQQQMLIDLKKEFADYKKTHP